MLPPIQHFLELLGFPFHVYNRWLQLCPWEPHPPTMSLQMSARYICITRWHRAGLSLGIPVQSSRKAPLQRVCCFYSWKNTWLYLGETTSNKGPRIYEFTIPSPSSAVSHLCELSPHQLKCQRFDGEMVLSLVLFQEFPNMHQINFGATGGWLVRKALHWTQMAANVPSSCRAHMKSDWGLTLTFRVVTPRLDGFSVIHTRLNLCPWSHITSKVLGTLDQRNLNLGRNYEGTRSTFSRNLSAFVLSRLASTQFWSHSSEIFIGRQLSQTRVSPPSDSVLTGHLLKPKVHIH